MCSDRVQCHSKLLCSPVHAHSIGSTKYRMATSASSYEGPRTQQSLPTDELPRSSDSLEPAIAANPRSLHLPRLVSLLAERDIVGPRHFNYLNLAARSTWRATGASSDVLNNIDGEILKPYNYVYRRVCVAVARGSSRDGCELTCSSLATASRLCVL